MVGGAARRLGEGRAPWLWRLSAAGVMVWLLLGALACGDPPPDSEADDQREIQPRGDLPSPEPALQTALWPGEGRPVLVASDTVLLLRSSPSDTSRASDRVDATRGEEIPFGETVYRTARTGALVVLADHLLTGRNFGPVSTITRDAYYSATVARGEWPFAPGDTLVLLQHRAEGTCFVRVGESVVEADPCPTVSTDDVRVAREPVTEWWVHVDAPDGRAGWVRVGDGLREAGRRF